MARICCAFDFAEALVGTAIASDLRLRLRVIRSVLQPGDRTFQRVCVTLKLRNERRDHTALIDCVHFLTIRLAWGNMLVPSLVACGTVDGNA
jgi:hypothetical protein